MKKLILLSSILLILSGPLPAQEILTLEQCRQMALVKRPPYCGKLQSTLLPRLYVKRNGSL